MASPERLKELMAMSTEELVEEMDSKLGKFFENLQDSMSFEDVMEYFDPNEDEEDDESIWEVMFNDSY